MGGSNSKSESSNALRLCRERKRFMKQAIDSRFALAAAHVSYLQSLKNIGISLRRYAEVEGCVEHYLSANSSHPSPSPSHIGGTSDSPVLSGSPFTISTARVSYMRSTGASALTVRVTPPPLNAYVEEGEFSMPPPPPPPPEYGSSWDYFDTADESFRFVGQNDLNINPKEMGIDGNYSPIDDDSESCNVHERSLTQKLEIPGKRIINSGNTERASSSANQILQVEGKGVKDMRNVCNAAGDVVEKDSVELMNLQNNKSSIEKDICTEREDPSEFITHRAKDFLSSIKDIESRFYRASESGKEVLRMLESGKIRVGYVEAKGRRPNSDYLAAFGASCCQGRATNMSDDQHVTKIITWKRTTSSRSSSSRNPLTTAKDNGDDSGSDFMDEFCMISGSHSSTLDRLYAWERKLYDEVKTSESIHKVYDRKCNKLRHQFAKDHSAQAVDKTRAVVKDLHSRITVALHAVDAISKRIEKMRDEELLPQLQELIQGLTRLWKAMLECHHSQYITISLVYHTKSSTVAPVGETQQQRLNQLQDEVEYFGLSFANWVNCYTLYVEALNNWLQNSILLPKERRRSRKVFSPRRYLAPPVFVLCRDWSNEIKSLPSQEVSDAIKDFQSYLRHSMKNQLEESNKKEPISDTENNELERKDDGKSEGEPSGTSCIQTSLTKVLDRLTKFSQASVKSCEDIRLNYEKARNAYDNFGAPPRSFSI